MDIRIAIASIILSLSLIPQIVHSIKSKEVNISELTIITTGLGLGVLLGVYIEMKYVFSIITTGMVFLGWVLLLFLKRFFEHTNLWRGDEAAKKF